MMRTVVLMALVTGIIGPSAAAAPAGRRCMTDPQGWYFDPPETIERRFRLYQAMGVDTLRVELDWRSLEASPGKWDSSRFSPYLSLVRAYGFRVKLIVGALMGPPRWFFDAHPDAHIMDEDGQVSLNTVSYWYPDLRRLMSDKVRGIRRVLDDHGLADRVDYVIPALGPAGEAVYPVPWTLGAHVTRQTMWCYDRHAQADFRDRMRRRYRTLDRANAAWGAAFQSWDEVAVPRPGERPGAFWHDVLTWYRDSKRAFVRWQAASLQRAFPGTKTLFYVPGTAFSADDWAEAVRTGRGNDRIMMMADSFFLMDLASRTGAWLQYTGSENEPEVRRLRAYLSARGRSAPPMWGENAGVPEAGRNPVHLADVVIRHGLWGLDYTHSHFAFEGDGVTPNTIMPLLQQAFARIGAWPPPPSGPRRGRFRVVSSGPSRMPGVPDGVERLDYESGVDGTPDWALALRPEPNRHVWVVNLHGHGAAGDQLYVRPDIRDLWLPEIRRRGLGVLTPNLRGASWMSPEAAADLRDLLAHVRRVYGGRQFILLGGSMGGSAALAYAALRPQDADAVIALCPASDIGAYARWCARAETPIAREIGLAIQAAYAGEPDEIAGVYAARSAVRRASRLTMPVIVCHGDRDAVIPVDGSRDLSRAMKGRPDFRYVELAGGDHEAPLAEAPDALEWALARLKLGSRR